MNIIVIPLNKIILDDSIVYAVKNYGGIVEKGTYVNENYTTPLNRMESSEYIQSPYEAMVKGIPLPPVILKSYKKTGYYEIIEGRHRIASSIILNYKGIHAIII